MGSEGDVWGWDPDSQTAYNLKLERHTPVGLSHLIMESTWNEHHRGARERSGGFRRIHWRNQL